MPRPSPTASTEAQPRAPLADSNNAQITVTSQQSRFHTDANDAPLSNEVDVQNLTISIGGRDVLDHAHLRIKQGVHYVLMGRNGTGKSTILRALAERRIPDIPDNLRILLLGQTRIIGRQRDMFPSTSVPAEQTVLEYVMTSDVRKEQLVRQARILSDSLERTDSSTMGITATRQVRVETLERELANAQLVASRRSGARGHKARNLVNAKQAELDHAKKLFVQVPNDSADDSEELKFGFEMLEATRLELEAMNIDGTESRARKVLLGLGFSVAQIKGPRTTLSGGWQTRCELASALVQGTDVLLLDEPTNYLDLPAVIWLQRYLSESIPGTSVVVVTHDRDFADAVADELILLRLVPAKTLELFKGTLTEYENEKRRQIRYLTKMKAALEKKTKHLEEAVDKGVKAAKKAGDDKKMKQAASKKKKLDERMGMEVNAKGGRFKLNRDRPGYSTSYRDDIEIPEMDPEVNITFPNQPEPLRFPGPIASLEKVNFTYTKSTRSVLKDVDLVIHPGDRVGLAGLNGSGKSTLIKIVIAAASGTVPRPTVGKVEIHSKARIACYSQHAVEDLEALGSREPERTALTHLSALSSSQQEMRSFLAKLGLRGPTVSDVSLGALSGGQRVRVALAECIFRSPHLLILDEVTTHLDADTIVALIHALKSWKGALLVATHDRFFMRCVIEGESLHDEQSEESDDEPDDADAIDGRVYHIRNGRLNKLERGMTQYEELVEKSLAKNLASGMMT